MVASLLPTPSLAPATVVAADDVNMLVLNSERYKTSIAPAFPAVATRIQKQATRGLVEVIRTVPFFAGFDNSALSQLATLFQ